MDIEGRKDKTIFPPRKEKFEFVLGVQSDRVFENIYRMSENPELNWIQEFSFLSLKCIQTKTIKFMHQAWAESYTAAGCLHTLQYSYIHATMTAGSCDIFGSC